MKRKITVISVCLMILFTTLPLANAQLIADYTGDVIHLYFEDDETIIEIDDRPNVDITEMGYEIVENKLFLQMCVVGEITFGENFSYVINFGPHMLGYYYGNIHNSSMLIDYEINHNFLNCLFEIDDNENISEYELIGYTVEINEMESWFDTMPDLFPPYIFFSLGAGRRYTSIGRGIYLKMVNIHHNESVDCILDVYYEGFFGLINSNIGYRYTIEPKGEWELDLLGWRNKPSICKVNVSLTISNYTITLLGISIGQWYFLNDFYRGLYEELNNVHEYLDTSFKYYSYSKI